MNFNEFNPDTVNPSIKEEIEMWTRLLDVLNKGLPVPFDAAKYVKKVLYAIEADPANKEHYDRLLTCCPATAEIREVRQFRPLIVEILNRISHLAQLNTVVKGNTYEN